MTREDIIKKIRELDINENVKANCVVLLNSLHFNECNEVLRNLLDKLKNTETMDSFIRKQSKILLVMSDIDYYVETYHCDFDDYFDDDDAILNY